MSVRQVSVKLLAEISGYINPLKAATQATKDFTAELNKAAKAGNLDAVASSAMKAGLTLSAGFLAINTAAARFEKQMSAVGAVTNASASEMEGLSDAALKAGKDTVFSATEAAKAETELGRAGLSTADILGGGLKGALSLAAAGQLDLAEAADVSAKTMGVFGLKGRDVGHIADVLAAAANKSATDVHELGFALKMGGLAARNAGLTMEDTVGTLAAFAKSALVGSDAGTSLKTMLQALAAPSDVAQKRMKELGIAAFDAEGNFVGVAKLAGILQTQLRGLTQEQRNEALATIFGADAMRAATILMNEGESGIRKMIAAVDDQGAAERTAAALTDNLVGDIERLTGSLETLAIQSGSGTNEGLRILTKGAGRLVDQIGQLPGPVQTVGTLLIGLGGASLLGLAGFVKMRQKSGELAESLSAMGPAGEKAARGLGKVTSAAGKLALGLGAVQVVGSILGTIFHDDLNPQIAAAAKGLEEWNTQGKLAGEAARLFGENSEQLQAALHTLTANGFLKAGDAVDDFLIGAVTLGQADSPLDRARQLVDAFDQSLVDLVNRGQLVAAAAQIRETGLSLDQVHKLFPGYSAAVETGAGKTQELGKVAKTAALELDELAGAMKDNIIKAFSLEEAQDKVTEATRDLAAQVKKQREEHVKGAGALTGNTQAALDNRAAVRDLTLDYADLIEKTAAEGKSTDGLRKRLEDQLVAMGFTRLEAQKYARELKEIPKEVSTKVKVEDDQARQDLNEINRLRLADKTIRVNVLGPTGGYRGFAEGGTPPLRAPFWVGERGPELMSLNPPRVYSHQQSMAMAGAVVPRERGWQGGGMGGGATVVNNYFNVTAPVGSNPREIGAQLMSYIRSYQGGSGAGL